MTNEIKSPDIRDFIIKTVTAAAVNSGDYGLGPETTSVIADAILKEFPSMEAVTLVGDPELELAILHDPIAWHALTIGRFYEMRKRGDRQAAQVEARLALRRVLRMDGGDHPCRFCGVPDSTEHDPEKPCGKAIATYTAMEDVS